VCRQIACRVKDVDKLEKGDPQGMFPKKLMRIIQQKTLEIKKRVTNRKSL
jgi:hypothetical protein